jgi:hypothetical protein
LPQADARMVFWLVHDCFLPDAFQLIHQSSFSAIWPEIISVIK